MNRKNWRLPFGRLLKTETLIRLILKELKSGISMVEDQILSILSKNWGLEVIDVKDKPFDPSEMEAYSMQEKEGLKEETVLTEFQRGYKLHGKVIRSSKVMVGKPKA